MTAFTVGSSVTLVCKRQNNLLPSLFPNEPTTVTYTGKVVTRANYDDKESIRIETGQQQPAIRVIPLQNIVEVDGVPFSFTPRETAKPQAPRVVMVTGSSGKTYKITVHSHGSIHCTCPGFGFRGKCNHVENFLKTESNVS